MDSAAIISRLAGVAVPHYEGLPATGARLPYTVTRPLLLDPHTGAISGDSMGWDTNFTTYCAAASPEASYNLAIAVMAALEGQRIGDSPARVSMGYAGAAVEGHYESQVTIQTDQGGIQ